MMLTAKPSNVQSMLDRVTVVVMSFGLQFATNFTREPLQLSEFNEQMELFPGIQLLLFKLTQISVPSSFDLDPLNFEILIYAIPAPSSTWGHWVFLALGANSLALNAQPDSLVSWANSAPITKSQSLHVLAGTGRL